MKILTKRTNNQITTLGFKALSKELGVSGFIEFMKQFDLGSGDYVKDREEWQKKYTVDSIATAIQEQKKKILDNE